MSENVKIDEKREEIRQLEKRIASLKEEVATLSKHGKKSRDSKAMAVPVSMSVDIDPVTEENFKKMRSGIFKVFRDKDIITSPGRGGEEEEDIDNIPTESDDEPEACEEGPPRGASDVESDRQSDGDDDEMDCYANPFISDDKKERPSSLLGRISSGYHLGEDEEESFDEPDLDLRGSDDGSDDGSVVLGSGAHDSSTDLNGPSSWADRFEYSEGLTDSTLGEGKDHLSGSTIISSPPQPPFGDTSLNHNSAGLDDWTQRFQRATEKLEKEGEAAELNRAVLMDPTLEILHLSQDFIHAAKTYGKIIISEIYMEEKTIMPVKMGGRAGGEKYIVNNILFKFALDSSGLFNGNHHYAAKVAGHELKGAIGIYNLGITPVSLPMMALVDYRGFRLIAVSLLPLSKASLIYGTKDGGFSIHKDDKTFNKYMRVIGKRLNLRSHVCGLQKGQTKRLWAAADVEGHIGKDERYYLLDFSRVLPPTRPNKSVYNGHLFQLFRKEFVSQYQTSLSPDAYSSFIINDPTMSEQNMDINNATEFLETVVVKRFAKEWMYIVLEADSQLTTHELKPNEEMHRRSINMRYLGTIVKELVPFLPSSRTGILVLMCECVARIVKNHLQMRLQEKMNELRLPLEVPYRQVVIEYMNLVFSNRKASQEYWNTAIMEDMKKYFNFSFFDEHERSSTFSLQQKVLWTKFADGIPGRWFVFSRLRKLTGLRFTQETMSKFYGKLRWNPHEPLDFLDLEEIGERVKHLNIVAKAEGRFFYLKAVEVSQLKLRTFTEHLYLRAIEKLEEALSSNPSDYEVLVTNCFARYNYVDSLYRTPADEELPFPPQQVEVVQLDHCFLRTLEKSKKPEILSAYAKFLERCQRFDRAEEYYLRVLRMQANHYFAALMYGNYLIRRGFLTEAHIFLARCVSSCRKSIDIINPFTGRPLGGAVRVYMDDGTFKTLYITAGTSVSTIKKKVIKLTMTKLGKMYTSKQLELMGQNLEKYDLLLTEEEVGGSEKPKPMTHLLDPSDRPWISLQRPGLGKQCRLTFRAFRRDEDLAPLETPFNVKQEYLGRSPGDTKLNKFFGPPQRSLQPTGSVGDIARVKLTTQSLVNIVELLGEGNDHFRFSPDIPNYLMHPAMGGFFVTQLDHALLGKCDPMDAIRMPTEADLKTKPDLKGVSRIAWIISATIAHAYLALMSYRVVVQSCTEESCENMSASQSTFFKWLYPETGLSETIPACQYVVHLRKWVEDQLLNPLKFPPPGSSTHSLSKKAKAKMEKESMATLRDINRRVFRIFGHIYYKHWGHLKTFNGEPVIRVVFLIAIAIVQEMGFPKHTLELMKGPTEELERIVSSSANARKAVMLSLHPGMYLSATPARKPVSQLFMQRSELTKSQRASRSVSGTRQLAKLQKFEKNLEGNGPKTDKYGTVSLSTPQRPLFSQLHGSLTMVDRGSESPKHSHIQTIFLAEDGSDAGGKNESSENSDVQWQAGHTGSQTGVEADSASGDGKTKTKQKKHKHKTSKKSSKSSGRREASETVCQLQTGQKSGSKGNRSDKSQAKGRVSPLRMVVHEDSEKSMEGRKSGRTSQISPRRSRPGIGTRNSITPSVPPESGKQGDSKKRTKHKDQSET